ncbi:hypothetical protein JAAARDRAFT_30681 [Jaapia argillacea MUCL 33604]|uniref:Uncharacterized protein n=1 Tax=Jaapia argillacea MUCL 33604 TaxID=933084 RepID=A0A067Q6T4_9AGAM|nr:hypothetical protein JAAARDRAFT_30681 [Jaapia argillacea MUCL 33604]
MTSRPSFKSKRRPLSAIFLGSSPSSSSSIPQIPDLPEPPSPGGSSNASGLPSPPATNSTGSGSTGDNSTNAGSVRLRSVSYPNPTMLNGNHDKTSGGNRASSEEDDDDNENEEDHTARLSNGQRSSAHRPSENSLALQRVKSLTQRNRMTIDKLSSISRLSTPSPSNAGRSSSTSRRSPLPPYSASSAASSSSASSSARNSTLSKTQSITQIRPPDHASGSETERESQKRGSRVSYTSSEDLATTPPSTIDISSHPPPATTRRRRLSEPASPDKLGLVVPLESSRPSTRQSVRQETRNASPGPSRPPRKRVSMALSAKDLQNEEEDDDDVASAALAAAAAVRRSPTLGFNSKRTRQPLPREFRDNRKSLDGKAPIAEPTTPHRNRTLDTRGSPSFRSATLRSTREPPRRHQSRWMSEDLTNAMDREDTESDLNAQISPSGKVYGRRQTLRGGSAESALGAHRSLVGEGLKAAGINTRRREGGDDVFKDERGQVGAGSIRRAVSNGAGSLALHGDRREERGLSRAGGSSTTTRINEGAGPPASSALVRVTAGSDPRTPANTTQNRSAHRSSYAGGTSRPATSMAGYAEDLNPPKTAPPTLRTYRSAYPLPERDRTALVLSASSRALTQPQPHAHPPPQDRAYSSPFNANRQTPLPSSSMSNQVPQPTSEHGRLMLESLSMFESNLTRLPPMGTTTTVTIPELLRSAQTIVHATERLNHLLRTATNDALERQIESDVYDEGIDASARIPELWKTVGAEFREGMRISDELVRTMTGFMLGVGKVMKDSAAAMNGTQHLRTGSLDEEVVTRRMTPEVPSGGRIGSDGRRSASSRHSWEPAPRDRSETMRAPSSRLDGNGGRPPSSLKNSRESDGSTGGEREKPEPLAPIPQRALLPASSVRRLFTPREQREQQMIMDSLDGDHEPSPTPASRHQSALPPDRYRTLPPLSIPPTLSTVPSESLLTRKPSLVADRRKISNNSNATVRASPLISALKTPGTTTSLTPYTVSNSPNNSAIPLSRGDSNGSGSSRTNVTFSRPSTVSVSTLSGLQQNDARKRTISATSDNDDPRQPAMTTVTADTIRTPTSGPETERDSRRRTLGRARVSLDSARDSDGSGQSASRDAQGTAGILPGSRKERRRTITEIFGHG